MVLQSQLPLQAHYHTKYDHLHSMRNKVRDRLNNMISFMNSLDLPYLRA